MAFVTQEALNEFTAQLNVELEKQEARIDSMNVLVKQSVESLAATALPVGWQAEVERCIRNESSKTEQTSQNLQTTCDAADGRLREFQDYITAQERKTEERMTALEQKGGKGYTGKGDYGDKGWGKPKDWEPKEFPGKEEDWKKFKEEVHDYLEEIDPSLVETLEWAGDDGGKGAKEEVTEDSLRTTTAEMSLDARDHWSNRTKVYKLLKR